MLDSAAVNQQPRMCLHVLNLEHVAVACSNQSTEEARVAFPCRHGIIHAEAGLRTTAHMRPARNISSWVTLGWQLYHDLAFDFPGPWLARDACQRAVLRPEMSAWRCDTPNKLLKPRKTFSPADAHLQVMQWIR